MKNKKYELCICPKCRKIFNKTIKSSNWFWSGNGTPRIFCKNCQRLKNYECEKYEVHIPKNIRKAKE